MPLQKVATKSKGKIATSVKSAAKVAANTGARFLTLLQLFKPKCRLPQNTMFCFGWSWFLPVSYSLCAAWTLALCMCSCVCVCVCVFY